MSRISIIDNELWAVVTAEQAAAIPCWTYVTQGLVTFGQKELLLSIPRGDEAEPPTHPLPLFEAICTMAKQGQFVGNGGHTQLGGNGLFGFHGVVYSDPAAPDGRGFPDANVLSMTLLYANEVAVAQQVGAARVLARLGRQTSHWPHPVVSVPGRAEVSLPEADGQSILLGVAKFGPPGITATREGERITLRIESEAGELLSNQIGSLAADQALCFLLQLARNADSCLVWSGGNDPSAISAPGATGERMGGCFLLLIPEEQSASRLFEDGFAILLNAPDSASVRQALASGTPLVLGGPDQPIHFAIEYVPSMAVQPDGHPAFLHIQLESTEDELADRIEMDMLSAYILQLRQAVQAGSLQVEAGQPLEIRVTLTGAAPELAARGLDVQAAQGLMATLYAITPPATSGRLEFTLLFRG